MSFPGHRAPLYQEVSVQASGFALDQLYLHLTLQCGSQTLTEAMQCDCQFGLGCLTAPQQLLGTRNAVASQCLLLVLTPGCLSRL